MGYSSFDLKSLYIGAKNGNVMDMITLMRFFHKDLRKRSFIGGRFNEDAYQEMSIKLIKCIKKFEYNSL